MCLFSTSLLAPLLALAACSLPPPPDVEPDADPRDAMPPDAMVIPDPAMLTVSPGSHDFTDVTVGADSGVQPLLVRNTGDEASGAVSVTLAGDHAGDFEIVLAGDGTDCAGAILDGGEDCTARVRFSPTAPGARTAHVEIAGEPGGTLTVDLMGNGLTPGDLVVTSGDTVAFGNELITLATAYETVTVQNTGDTATAALTVQLGDATSYSKTNDTCHGAPLGAGQTCSVQVRFNPTAVGATPSTLSIRESAEVGVAVTLTGTGAAQVQMTAPTGGTVSSTPSGLSCGPTCGPVTFTQSPITLTANAALGYDFGAWGGGCAGTIGDTCSLALTAPTTTVSATFDQLDCVPNVIECNDAMGVYTDCGPTGEVEVQMTCPLGCSTTSEQCVDVNPSNGLATYLDMAAGGPDVVLGPGSTIDTETGVVYSGAASVTIPNFLIDMPSPTPDVRVFVVRTLTISGTTTVAKEGPAVAIVADGDITITATLDLSASATQPGAGASSCVAASWSETPTSPSPGGGGGGRGTRGGNGGSANGGTIAGLAGVAADSNYTVVPLEGGCSGGTVFEWTSYFAQADGGAGGGALQLVSRSSVRLTGNGVINASGGGGRASSHATYATGGGGGGSGGVVLIEAPQVVLDGAGVVVAAKGGGGAAASVSATAAHGANGGTNSTPAPGGTAAGQASGGAGGTGPTAATAGGNGSASNDGGGGGGGAGRARFNTSSGGINPLNGAAVRAETGTGPIGTRLVP
jgi:hypothetical protein